MRILVTSLAALLVASVPVSAEVRVLVEDLHGRAMIGYECTAGEVVRAFALDVTVSTGAVTNVSHFHKGESTVSAQGYGIFPAAFRDHITVGSGPMIDWDAPGYTPLAVVADNPTDTLPGLGSNGVTLEFGALWDPTNAMALPPASGTLCVLELSQPATVTVGANGDRGGVVAASPDVVLGTVFNSAAVDPALSVPLILAATTDGDQVTVQFQGGELESAYTVRGAWTGTGNSSGTHNEPVAGETMKFFRVRAWE